MLIINQPQPLTHIPPTRLYGGSFGGCPVLIACDVAVAAIRTTATTTTTTTTTGETVTAGFEGLKEHSGVEEAV